MLLFNTPFENLRRHLQDFLQKYLGEPSTPENLRKVEYEVNQEILSPISISCLGNEAQRLHQMGLKPMVHIRMDKDKLSMMLTLGPVAPVACDCSEWLALGIIDGVFIAYDTIKREAVFPFSKVEHPPIDVVKIYKRLDYMKQIGVL